MPSPLEDRLLASTYGSGLAKDALWQGQTVGLSVPCRVIKQRDETEPLRFGDSVIARDIFLLSVRSLEVPDPAINDTVIIEPNTDQTETLQIIAEPQRRMGKRQWVCEARRI